MSNSIIRCQDVWKLYGPSVGHFDIQSAKAMSDAQFTESKTIPAVRDANLEIAEGEIFVIMGLSGSGKSTLVRCLTGLITPTFGDLMVYDQNLRTISRNELIQLRRHRMGMVFQDFALLPHLTVLGNIAFPLRIQKLDRTAREARAREMAKLVGLEGREDYYPHELSGGQQQRVGIARSLTTDPDIWFLDEPFSALDPLIRFEMQGEFLKLQRTLHKTIVFITHDFDEAIYLADRIAIMESGNVVQIGTPEELIVNPASPYVAEFTRKIPRSKVLTIGSIMTSPTEATKGDSVSQTSLVAAVAERVLRSADPIPVTDTTGSVIGSINRDAIIDVVFGEAGVEA